MPLSLAINIAMVTLLVMAVIALLHFSKLKQPLSYFILSLIMACYLSLLWIIKIPEERIHFLEYGILGILIEKALRIKKRMFLTYFLTFILTVIFGWLDEVIQYYLPGRFFGWRDVLYNALGGILGVIFIYVKQREIPDEEKFLR